MDCAAALCAAAAAAVVWYVVLFFRLRRRRRTSPPLPPGPTGLPVVGSLLSLPPELHLHFTELARTYGPIYRIRLGRKLAVVVSSPALAREVLRDNDLAMSAHDMPAVGRLYSYGGSDMLYSPVGPTWRMLRRICVREVLSPSSLDAAYGMRRREVRAAVRHLGASAGREVEVGTQMFVTVLNVITSMLWKDALEAGDGEDRGRVGREFRELMGEITELIGQPNVSDLFPALARFDLQGKERKMARVMERLDGVFNSVIERKRRKNKEAAEKGGEKDLLDHMLRLEEEGGDGKTPFTMAHVKALLTDIFVAGTETTSDTMEWAMAEMLLNPEIMRLAQLELDQVVGRDDVVEDSHLPKLRYLGAVIKETLRLHPIVPLLIPHRPTETCTIGGYTVPKGSSVFLNAWAIHRDPSVWKDPLVFDPERFLGADVGLDFNGSNFGYIPFGSGRRICAGIPVAERMATYILATLLHSFDWTVPEGTELDLTERFAVTMKMAKPLVAIPTPRLHNPEQYL
ncbi:putative cytochrome P450 76M5-like [Iris pallida]|uniref:Cytochrome P450 76M5-like n=1 Tax=Iris pallida TaxID=29817 RepID=A0AAX6I8T8_IRIPA|nr:putative cytochrome P450 76M5-like [Iris pallida]